MSANAVNGKCREPRKRIGRRVASILVIAGFGALVLGCAPIEKAEGSGASASEGSGQSAQVQPTAPTSSPTASVPSEAAETYEAETAAWPDSLPVGYEWPAYDDLPTGVGSQIAAGQNAAGVYRCILLDAAWTANHEDGDPKTAINLARKADEYAVPDNPSLYPVSGDPDTTLGEIDIAQQICEAVTGDIHP